VKALPRSGFITTLGQTSASSHYVRRKILPS
jgi:hypothetical protein